MIAGSRPGGMVGGGVAGRMGGAMPQMGGASMVKWEGAAPDSEAGMMRGAAAGQGARGVSMVTGGAMNVGKSGPQAVDMGAILASMGLDAKSVVLSAEHGIIALNGPSDAPQVGETFDLMPGYGDATVFLHDTMYGVRDGVVETVWEVQARGKLR